MDENGAQRPEESGTQKRHPLRDFVNKRRRRVRIEGPYNEYYDTVSERFALGQIILYILLLIFVAVMVISHASSLTYNNLYYFFKDLSASVDGWDASVNDNIVYSAGENRSFTPYRGGFAVVGNKSVSAYTQTGRQTLNEKSNMTSPAVSASGKYILVYDKSGKNVMLCNSFSRIFGEEYEYTVSMAKVSDSGVFAVVTDGERSASVLYVYNSNQFLVNKAEINRPVIAVALDADGKKCAYVTVGTSAENGVFRSSVTVFDIGSDQKSMTAETDGYLYQCGFLPDGRLLCMTEKGVYTISADGTVTSVTQYEAKLQLFSFAENGCAFTTVAGDGTKTAFVYDGEKLSRYDLTEAVKAVSYGEGTLFLVTDKGILRISADGERSFHETDTSSVSLCICSADSLYLCRETSAEYITFP